MQQLIVYNILHRGCKRTKPREMVGSTLNLGSACCGKSSTFSYRLRNSFATHVAEYSPLCPAAIQELPPSPCPNHTLPPHLLQARRGTAGVAADLFLHTSFFTAQLHVSKQLLLYPLPPPRPFLCTRKFVCDSVEVQLLGTCQRPEHRGRCICGP